MTTVPVKSNISYLPRMFGFRRQKAVQLPDGKAEIVALDICYEALVGLSQDAQSRVLEHTVKMLNERARVLNEYTFEEE